MRRSKSMPAVLARTGRQNAQGFGSVHKINAAMPVAVALSPRGITHFDGWRAEAGLLQ